MAMNNNKNLPYNNKHTHNSKRPSPMRLEEGHLVVDSNPAIEKAAEGVANHVAIIRLVGTRPRANANDLAKLISKKAKLPLRIFGGVILPERFLRYLHLRPPPRGGGH
jgi:hypothetical protein